MLGRT